MQDFTGMPVVVDIAALRAEVARKGKNPEILNPLIPAMEGYAERLAKLSIFNFVLFPSDKRQSSMILYLKENRQA